VRDYKRNQEDFMDTQVSRRGGAFARASACGAVALLSLAASPALAQEAITLPGQGIFPESITSTEDGTIYAGGIATGNVYRAAPGATEAEVWVTKEAGGFQMVLGVLADEQNGVLWACSALFGDPNAPPTELKAIDLASGEVTMSMKFPGDTGTCNDIEVGPDGAAYATDTPGGRILKWTPGSDALELWAHDARFENGLDGIAFGPDGRLYVNNVSQGTLFAVALNDDGTAGAVTQIETSAPLAGPDGMRTAADGVWIAENQSGKVTRAVIDGDKATIEVLGEGFDAPTGITQHGDTVWVVEAKFAYMFGDKAGQDPGAFQLKPIAGGCVGQGQGEGACQ
jgi:sugar lactone lactonase YvrE